MSFHYKSSSEAEKEEENKTVVEQTQKNQDLFGTNSEKTKFEKGSLQRSHIIIGIL